MEEFKKGQQIMVRPPYGERMILMEVVSDFEGNPKDNLECLKKVEITPIECEPLDIIERSYSGGISGIRLSRNIVLEIAFAINRGMKEDELIEFLKSK